MNKFLTIFALLIVVNGAAAQPTHSIEEEMNAATLSILEKIKNDAISQNMLNTARNIYFWKKDENTRAYMLSVDIPYPEIEKPLDYFSITIVKFKNIDRPRTIAFAVSSMIDPSRGITFYFANRNDDLTVSTTEPTFANVPFTEISAEFSALRASDMYLEDNKSMDLLALMLNNAFVFFEFADKNGQSHRLGYPLAP